MDFDGLKVADEFSRDISSPVINVLREDESQPGSTLYTQGAAILRSTPGGPATVIAGNVKDKGLVNGDASNARFGIIFDFLFYEPRRIAIVDYHYGCIRGLDLEANAVSNIAGICSTEPVSSSGLPSFAIPTRIVYLKRQSYFIVYAYSTQTFSFQLLKIDSATRSVSLLNDSLTGRISKVRSLLVDQSETVLYVGYSGGLAKVDLHSFEAIDLTFHGPAVQNGPAAVGTLNYMRWLVDGVIIVAVTEEAVAVIDLGLEEVDFLCNGKLCSQVM